MRQNTARCVHGKQLLAQAIHEYEYGLLRRFQRNGKSLVGQERKISRNAGWRLWPAGTRRWRSKTRCQRSRQ